MNQLQLFLPCAAGVEDYLANEVQRITGLPGDSVLRQRGGVALRTSWRDAMLLNLYSRLAQRVLVLLSYTEYRNEQDLYRAASEVAWEVWFTPHESIKVEVTAQHSPLTSLNFAALKIKDAVCDRFRVKANGVRPDVDTQRPDVRIYTHLSTDSCSLYIDTSGEPLFKRGARAAQGEAPIKENLAAGILKLTGWKPGTALLDPMCGGGTFLVEAAQIALDIAPGLVRNFGFEKLNGFDATLWTTLRSEAEGRRKPIDPLPIYGSELYGDTLKLALANLHTAGLAQAVQLKQANALEISAPAETGVIVTNPPYGERMGEQQELAEFYPKFGDALKQKFAGWNCYILSADMSLPKLIKLQVSKRTPLFNGALECRLFEYKIVAGSMRSPKFAQSGDRG